MSANNANRKKLNRLKVPAQVIYSPILFFNIIIPCFSSYTIIKSCWEREPTDRPSFVALVTQISSSLQEIKDYLPLIDTHHDTNCNGSDRPTSLIDDSESKFEEEEKL